MFAERLKRFRKSKKLTHEDMAKFLGISRQGYGNYEKGIREPDNETMGRLAELFDTTVDYLLGLTNVPNGRTINDQAMNAAVDKYNRLPHEKKKIIDDMIDALSNND